MGMGRVAWQRFCCWRGKLAPPCSVFVTSRRILGETLSDILYLPSVSASDPGTTQPFLWRSLWLASR
jgi:hypothetical protein